MMNNKLAHIDHGFEPAVDECRLVLEPEKWGDSAIIAGREQAIDAVTALIHHYNITAEELPCLWLSVDNLINF